MLVSSAAILPSSFADSPKAPTPRVVMFPPLNSIRPPLSASAPDAAVPNVVTIRFVPNIWLLAVSVCNPFASAPMAVILEFSSLMVPP
jgi:hypothetical protein